MNSKSGYFEYWGKAERDPSAPQHYHLLPFHSLDVAAVGMILLQHNGQLLKQLSELAGIPADRFKTLYVWFLALHDVGKFSSSFQSLRADIQQQLTGHPASKKNGPRHDELGVLLWNKYLKSQLQEMERLPAEGRQRSKSAVDFWALPVLGHHGAPPAESGGMVEDYFSMPDGPHDATEFAADCAAILFDGEPAPDLGKPALLSKASWWMAGLAVLCDWLGSNRDYFPYHMTPMPLADYWELAQQQAENAVSQSGLLPAGAAPLQDIQALFSPTLKTPTPLQQLCSTLPLHAGQQLFILEDVTGAGKTEAALYLSHRLLANNSAQGLYFGLPTMATANAMYKRMSDSYRQMFDASDTPSLVLAHSARKLSRNFRDSLLPASPDNPPCYGDGTEDAAAHCNTWLADNPKKALLAQIGVGTIDQTLLAILPSRHQSLRMLGLLGKLLIVDEVHAYDAYTNRLLCRLIKAHAASGGSALLLSATLSTEQRQQFSDYFREGAGWEPQDLTLTSHNDYPLLTHSHQQQTTETVTATRASVRRRVNTRFIHRFDDIEQRLAEALANGDCACWIRNTVHDARDAFQQLRQRHPDWQLQLFHARFCLGDRLKIETQVLDTYGLDSTPEQRRGRILIATQVVEQSLDLDFDLMVSDLAPIDSLIQRAGRLWRHQRPGRSGKMPQMCIFSPPLDVEPTANWYTDFLPKAKRVYANHGQLWLGAKLLQGNGGFTMPDDARTLIEGVYSAEAQEGIPAELLQSSNTNEGDRYAETSLASANALDIERGYRNEHKAWWDEALTPTRLGEDTRSVYLARWDGETLAPWTSSNDYPWQNSSLQLAQRIIAGETTAVDEPALTDAMESVRETLPARGQWGLLLPLRQTQNDLWIGKATDSNGEAIDLYYSATDGLMSASEVVGTEPTRT